MEGRRGKGGGGRYGFTARCISELDARVRGQLDRLLLGWS